ncbi:MAG: glycosyltransferase family 4 protein [Bdellovibrionales bacterium]|nr:glycosyltransferase family 4 protein [Bdellovibrionales bacterium]
MENMRVLLVNLEKGWRGGENQVLLLARYLKEKQDYVAIAYPKVSTAIPRYKKEFDVLELDSTSDWRPSNINAISNYVLKHNIQILHANSSKSHGLCLRVKKKHPHLKLVVHRRVATPPSDNFFTRKKYLSKLVDSYVSLSNAISTELAAYGVPKEKIVRIPSGVIVDSSPFDKATYKEILAKKCNVSSKNTFIGMACAISIEKGVDTFLRFAKLLENRNDVSFFIAGTGPKEEEYKRLASELMITDKVHFLGFLNPVTEYLRALDVFIMPSRQTKTFREGLGSVLLEAVQARTSIIASNIDGIPDVIIDKKTGHLIPVDDFHEMYKTFESLNSETEKSIQDNAIKHIEADFTSEIMAKRNRDNYQRLLNK